MKPLQHYGAVWAVDFEFTAPPGHRPTPLCVVARELHTGQLVRQWLDGTATPEAPYGTGGDTLLIAYTASAEWNCHLALGWPMPRRVLDLYAEFCNLTSGTRPPAGRGLLGALAYYGLPALEAVEKKNLRALAMRGGPYSPTEQAALLDYCQTDVDALAKLLPAMLPKIDLPRALLRGRYTVAVARLEWCGVPLDVPTLTRLGNNWDRIKGRLVATMNERYGVFEPVGRTIDPNTRLGAALYEAAAASGGRPKRTRGPHSAFIPSTRRRGSTWRCAATARGTRPAGRSRRIPRPGSPPTRSSAPACWSGTGERRGEGARASLPARGTGVPPVGVRRGRLCRANAG